jgi:hypothetical protein
VSKFKPLIEAIQATPARVVEAWQVNGKSVDASRDRHASVTYQMLNPSPARNLIHLAE